MRPLEIMERPILPPNVCAVCGVQSGREYFVDLGLDLGVLYNPLVDGPVYLCNECMESVVSQYERKLIAFKNIVPVGTFNIRDKYIKKVEDEPGTDAGGSASEIIGSSGEVDRPAESDDSTDGGESSTDSGSDESDEPTVAVEANELEFTFD